MRRIPRFVIDRNRSNGLADQQASGYAPRPRYLLGTAANGVHQIDDFPLWLTQQNFTPRERRLIDELRVGEAMTLAVGVLHCEPPVDPEAA